MSFNIYYCTLNKKDKYKKQNSMVECLPFKKKVIGSIPCASLNINYTLNFYIK